MGTRKKSNCALLVGPAATAQITRLENGLKVVTAEMPHMASVSLGLWVGVGGRYESAELCGASHFIEHLLFKGTRRRSARRISQDVEGVGGYLNAFTSEEHTCFYSKARHEKFAELLDVLLDMFLNSTFAPEEIDKERSVIKEELAMYLDQPQQHVQELLNETLWPKQPLGRPLTGTEDNLDAIERQQLLRFKRQNYVAPATLLVAAGNLHHAEFVQAVSRYARRFHHGLRPSWSPAHADQSGPRIRLCSRQTEQTQVALGIRTCSRHDPRRYPLRLLNTLLGDNMSSRLFQILREEHGLAYSISSSLSFFHDVGTLDITAGVETEKLPAALGLILRELSRLTTTLPSRAELRRARDYLVGQIDLSLENTENQMMWLGEQVLGYGTIPSALEIKDQFHRITPSAIRAVARDFFRPDRLNLALVSPLRSARKLRRVFTLG